MRLTPLRRSGLLGAAAVAAVAVLALTTTASAAGPEEFDGNIEWNWKTACSVGGLTGTSYTDDKFTFTGGKDTQDLDITAVPAGVTITGVVVKGGDAYYVYLADDLGALPWNDLKAPLNNGGKVPDISHWYACGVKDETPSSSVTTSSTTSSSTATSTSTPTSTPASSSSVIATTTTTTTTSAAAAVDQDLASTGFGSAWLLGLGAALVAAGAAVVLVMRRRRA
jgi:LPXTG-motif cell wall-anchored protein